MQQLWKLFIPRQAEREISILFHYLSTFNNFSFTFSALQSCSRLLLFRFKFHFIVILSISRPKLKLSFLLSGGLYAEVKWKPKFDCCAPVRPWDRTNIYPGPHQRGRPEQEGSRECPLPARAACSVPTWWTCQTCQTSHSDTRTWRTACNERTVRGDNRILFSLAQLLVWFSQGRHV